MGLNKSFRDSGKGVSRESVLHDILYIGLSVFESCNKIIPFRIQPFISSPSEVVNHFDSPGNFIQNFNIIPYQKDF